MPAPRADVRKPLRSKRLQEKRERASKQKSHQSVTAIRDGFDDAMADEQASLRKHGVFDLTAPRPSADQQVLDTMYHLKVKQDGRKKARLVVRGDQAGDVEHDSCYSPTASRTTALVLLALDPSRVVAQLDVRTAFLHAPLPADACIYVRLPDGEVRKLVKALYGLKQSPQLFYQHLRRHLTDLGWHATAGDECLFVRSGVWLLVYVDDILVCAHTEAEASTVLDELERSFTIERERGRNYIGIQYGGDGECTMHMDAYLQSIASTFCVPPHPVSTPLTSDYKAAVDTQTGGEEADGDLRAGQRGMSKQEQARMKREYQKIVGVINYLSTSLRPDICYAASILAERLQSPRTLLGPDLPTFSGFAVQKTRRQRCAVA